MCYLNIARGLCTHETGYLLTGVPIDCIDNHTLCEVVVNLFFRDVTIIRVVWLGALEAGCQDISVKSVCKFISNGGNKDFRHLMEST